MADEPRTRTPDYIRELGMGRLEELMVAAKPWSKIVAALTVEFPDQDEDAFKRWRSAVVKRWASEDAEMRPARKDLWRARLDDLYGSLLEQARDARSDYAKTLYFSEAVKVAKLAVDLDGLNAPIAIKHEGKLDVAAMTPAEREAEIAALLAKREAARAAKGTN